MIRIACYNVENLFARPNAFNPLDYQAGQPAINAYFAVNNLFNLDEYTDDVKQQMLEHLVTLDIYRRNEHGAARRKMTSYPQWAWFRKNSGSFDRQPRDSTEGMEITAKGRDDWIGWVELAVEPTNEVATRMTARVIQEVNADIIGIVEAENRPSLVRFNHDLLDDMYGHVMLVDGNDARGIDVGILTRDNCPIGTIHSNVDLEDDTGIVFSRDCPQYQVHTPGGKTVHVLINHFKSQSGGGDAKRLRQATQLRRIADELVAQGHHVVALGDFNEGPRDENSIPENLSPLFEDGSPLVDCYSLDGFEDGGRPGTWTSCGWSSRLDYIFISRGLIPFFNGGSVFRTGLWGTTINPPQNWEIYDEIDSNTKQASDHALVYVDLDI